MIFSSNRSFWNYDKDKKDQREWKALSIPFKVQFKIIPLILGILAGVMAKINFYENYPSDETIITEENKPVFYSAQAGIFYNFNPKFKLSIIGETDLTP